MHDKERPSAIVLPKGERPAIALLVLTCIYACHSLDRAVVSLVAEPMKREMALSDSQVGVITGLGYGLAFGLAALPAGALADRVNRVRLLAALSFAWSAMTAIAGLGQSFVALLLARMGVGAAEAGGQPTALSILSDKIHEERRAGALGVFYFGGALGYAASFFGGGLVAEALGWRAAFFLAGAPGIIFALLLLATVSEPVRGAMLPNVSARDLPAPDLATTLRWIGSHPALRHLYGGLVLASFWFSAIFGWMVPLMMRNRGMSLSSAGLAAGVTMGISQACGALLAGMLSDRLARGGRHRGGHIAAAALLASVPLGLGFILAPGRTTAISCLVLFGVFGAAWTSPGYNAILGTVEPRMRGRAMALIQLLTTMCGAALAPFVIGVLSDAVGGSQSLVTALALLFPVGLWSALHFRLASRAIARSSAA